MAKVNQAAERLAECTFKPRVNGDGSTRKTAASAPNAGARKLGAARFDHLHQQATRQQQESRGPTIEERELAECTFKPQTNDYHPKEVPPPPGYEQAVSRMRRVLDEKEQAEAEALEAARKRAALASKPPAPFNFQTDRRADRRHPLLYMDINLGPGRTGRIGLHGDDDPRALAANFARAYQLDGAMQAKLEGLIDKYLREVVPEIANEQGGGAPSTSASPEREPPALLTPGQENETPLPAA